MISYRRWGGGSMVLTPRLTSMRSEARSLQFSPPLFPVRLKAMNCSLPSKIFVNLPGTEPRDSSRDFFRSRLRYCSSSRTPEEQLRALACCMPWHRSSAVGAERNGGMLHLRTDWRHLECWFTIEDQGNALIHFRARKMIATTPKTELQVRKGR